MKIIDSCKLIYGKNRFFKMFAAGVIGAAVMLIGALSEPLWKSDFISGFIEGFCTVFCGAALIFTVIFMLGGAFGAVSRVNPGYKYFHSPGGGEIHFKRGLAASNLAGIVLNAMYAAVGAVFFQSDLFVYMICAALFCMGWANISGGFKSVWAKTVSFIAVGLVFGFIPGFIGGGEVKIPLAVMIAAVGVCAAFYIICVVITFKNAEKLWRREE